MHLILEPDNPSIQIKEKMSIVEQGTLGDKKLYNGDNSNDVSNGNSKENVGENLCNEEKESKFEECLEMQSEIQSDADKNGTSHVDCENREESSSPDKTNADMAIDDDDNDIIVLNRAEDIDHISWPIPDNKTQQLNCNEKEKAEEPQALNSFPPEEAPDKNNIENTEGDEIEKTEEDEVIVTDPCPSERSPNMLLNDEQETELNNVDSSINKTITLDISQEEKNSAKLNILVENQKSETPTLENIVENTLGEQKAITNPESDVNDIDMMVSKDSENDSESNITASAINVGEKMKDATESEIKLNAENHDEVVESVAVENIIDINSVPELEPIKESKSVPEIEKSTETIENLSERMECDEEPESPELVHAEPDPIEILATNIEDVKANINNSSATIADPIKDEITMECDESSTTSDISITKEDALPVDNFVKDANKETGEESIKIVDEPVLCHKDTLENAIDSESNDTALTKVDDVTATVQTNLVEESDKNIESEKDDVEEIKQVDDDIEKSLEQIHNPPPENNVTNQVKVSNVKLSLDILSDDEDEVAKSPASPLKTDTENNDKQTINIDDDDDIMLIDEDSNVKPVEETEKQVDDSLVIEEDKTEKKSDTVSKENDENLPLVAETDVAQDTLISTDSFDKIVTEAASKTDSKVVISEKPLVSDNFLKSHKKNLADMTRDELEEFCVLKIVESIIDRSSLTDIRSKLKSMSQSIEEFKKMTMMLTKQNRDLQVVLKSVQEEQKKSSSTPITPLKITRSVGMQVLMTDKMRRKGPLMGNNATNNTSNRPNRNNANSRVPANTTQIHQNIPVPRLIPATSANPATKNTNSVPASPIKAPVKAPVGQSPVPNGVKSSPTAKPEKRPHNKMMTVDLTDDEPPSKVQASRTPPANPPVRVIASQNLLTPRAQATQAVSSPRKVYIPIGGHQAMGNVRGPPGTVMLKPVPGPRGPRGLAPRVMVPPTAVRMPGRVTSGRHPAPLPEIVKQYQPPNWKALPPAPDLKLAKVENGIVISWKIEGYLEDSYEEIASYQLFAYQETSSPPSTTLWKKIGDVKALPLPMACTLTQFMAGHKYYFAVRAVDVKSRLGPFSLPGSILLLNKM